MDTGILILILAFVVVVLAVVGYFFYKYYLEPHDALSHIMTKKSSTSAGTPVAQSDHGSSSMAGHLIKRMSKAKKHSNKAVKKISEAKHHLSKAQQHASS